MAQAVIPAHERLSQEGHLAQGQQGRDTVILGLKINKHKEKGGKNPLRVLFHK